MSITLIARLTSALKGASGVLRVKNMPVPEPKVSVPVPFPPSAITGSVPLMPVMSSVPLAAVYALLVRLVLVICQTAPV